MLKHLAIGFLVSFIAIVTLYMKKGRDTKTLAAAPFWILLCELWSFSPSILKHLPFRSLTSWLGQDPQNNIFFFYGILHNLRSTGGVWALGIIFFVYFYLLTIFIRHLGMQEKVLRGLKKGSEPCRHP